MYKHRLGANLAIVMCLFNATLTSSEARAQVEAGKFRIGAAIGAFSYTDLDIEGVSVETKDFTLGPSGDLRLGYLPLNILEVGLNLGVQHVDIDVEGASDDATTWRIGPYVDLNFPVNSDGTAVLAPGLGVVYARTDGGQVDTEGVEIRLSGTFKYFVVANASLDISLDFAYFIGESDGGGFGDIDADGFMIGPRIGISIWP